MKSITEINTLQCLHENKYRKAEQKLIHYNVFMKMKYIVSHEKHDRN